MELITANGWSEVLKDEFTKSYFKALTRFVDEERSKCDVFPPVHNVFAAFNLCDIDNVKVVIIGQDPYHGFGQANGLAFSVDSGVKFPPSLKNILREVADETGRESKCADGNLEPWARDGVLLLNTVLTVRAHEAGSHCGQGWEEFTDSVIRKVSDKCSGVVFILWGKHAMSKEKLIDSSKHLILKGVHPSPLSAYRGFFGCNHFVEANNYLIEKGKEPVEW